MNPFFLFIRIPLLVYSVRLFVARASEPEAGFSPVLNPVAEAPQLRRQPVCTGRSSPALDPVAVRPRVALAVVIIHTGCGSGRFQSSAETRDLQAPRRHQVRATKLIQFPSTIFTQAYHWIVSVYHWIVSVRLVASRATGLDKINKIKYANKLLPRIM